CGTFAAIAIVCHWPAIATGASGSLPAFATNTNHVANIAALSFQTQDRHVSGCAGQDDPPGITTIAIACHRASKSGCPSCELGTTVAAFRGSSLVGSVDRSAIYLKQAGYNISRG